MKLTAPAPSVARQTNDTLTQLTHIFYASWKK